MTLNLLKLSMPASAKRLTQLARLLTLYLLPSSRPVVRTCGSGNVWCWRDDLTAWLADGQVGKGW